MHTFRAPAKPLEPPTPRTSVLGLDRLAHEKRAAAAALNGDSSRKKAKLAFDDDEGGTSNLFKGMFFGGGYPPHSISHMPGLTQKLVPTVPASRTSTRHRGEETPSHPGGLSDSARKVLEERRKAREKNKGVVSTCLIQESRVGLMNLNNFSRRYYFPVAK